MCVGVAVWVRQREEKTEKKREKKSHDDMLVIYSPAEG